MIIRAIITMERFLQESAAALREYRDSSRWAFPTDLLSSVHADMGLPNNLPLESLNNPAIIHMIASDLLLDSRVPDELRRTLGRIVWQNQKTKRYLRFRFFDPENAIYFGCPLHTRSDKYEIWDSIPVLIVKTRGTWLEDDTSGGNDVGWITRGEVRLLTALSFGTDYGYRVFQLGGSLDIPAWAIGKGSSTLLGRDRIKDTLAVIRRVKSESDTFRRAFDHTFHFARDRSDQLPIRIIKEFDISDRLVLRTSLHFLKAGMLFYLGNRFAEDAFANMYFALEGALRLIHRRHRPSSTFAIAEAKRLVETIFPDEAYAEALDEFYERRIEIVHPEPDFESNWTLSAMADDFLDNYAWIRRLFLYAVSGILIENELGPPLRRRDGDT